MHQMHTGTFLGGIGLLLMIGCASPVPESSPTGAVFEVEISETIPKVITVKERDEVRWVNKTNSPVHILLTKPVMARLSCMKGFVSTEGFEFVGSPNPDVTIGAMVNSHEFASLCFSDAGIYDYTVQREQETKLDGTVMVK
jgi:plastocyanin